MSLPAAATDSNDKSVRYSAAFRIQDSAMGHPIHAAPVSSA